MMFGLGPLTVYRFINSLGNAGISDISYKTSYLYHEKDVVSTLIRLFVNFRLFVALVHTEL